MTRSRMPLVLFQIMFNLTMSVSSHGWLEALDIKPPNNMERDFNIDGHMNTECSRPIIIP